MSDIEQNRSEQPTPHKLAKAREKGTVARGQDLGFLTSSLAFLGYTWLVGPEAMGQVALTWRELIVSAPQVLTSPNALLALTGAALATLAKPVAFLAGAVFLVVLVFEIVQTGPVFSTEPFRLDFGRLNPANGLKRLFTIRMLIETGKNVLKLTVYVAIAFLVLREALQGRGQAIGDGRDLALALADTGRRLILLFAVAAAVFAGLDQLIVRRDFLNRMRMSRREVRREARDREGEPRMKQRRQKLHREFVKASQSLRNVRGADLLITNPTHFAVALRYDPRVADAPIIVAQGAHALAFRLKRMAFMHGLVIIENKPLAQALFHQGELNRPVPSAFFRPVADIYLAIRRAAAAQQGA